MRPSHIALLLGAALVIPGCATVREMQDPTTLPVTGEAAMVQEGKATSYSVAIEIDASPEVIWEILMDGPAYPTWNSTILSLEGSIVQGDEIKLVSSVNPERTFTLEVSELTPRSRMVWEDGMALGMFLGVRTYTLIPTDDGHTVFTMAEVYSGGMARSVVKNIPDMRPSFEAWVADLKAEAEKRAG